MLKNSFFLKAMKKNPFRLHEETIQSGPGFPTLPSLIQHLHVITVIIDGDIDALQFF